MPGTLQQSPLPNNYSTTKECKEALQFIEDVTSNSDQVQHRVLAEILSHNAGVEYLTRHGLRPNTDRQTFKNIMPVIAYEDIRSDIKRIANGDKSPIFCSEPISEIFTSSGTSGGEVKMFPTTEDERVRRSSLNCLFKPVMSQFVSDLDQGKGMFFLFIRPEAKTPGGLVCSPVVTSFHKSKEFKERPYDPFTDFTSPNEVILCPDSYQSMYAHLLCGLCLRNQPDTELAAFIEQECSKSSWQGIITRLWPNTKYIDAIVTGSMSHYTRTIDYYSNGLPLVSKKYCSSECLFGVNLNPLCKLSEVSYTLIPTMAYFEFLPINGKSVPESPNHQLDLVDLADVQIGQEYELVVTTYTGLYRFRVGDVLQVTGFKNKAPQFKFICRRNVVLSIDSDKTDEVDLQNAVQNAINHLLPFDATLVEYTSYADVSTIPGHYVLFWELKVNKSKPIPPSIFERCCLAVEESLNTVYRQIRASDNVIGPLEIRIVENGTFDKLMDYAINLGSSTGQYKTPRCVKLVPIVDLLNSSVVSSYFSQNSPKWDSAITSGMIEI